MHSPQHRAGRTTALGVASRDGQLNLAAVDAAVQGHQLLGRRGDIRPPQNRHRGGDRDSSRHRRWRLLLEPASGDPAAVLPYGFGG